MNVTFNNANTMTQVSGASFSESMSVTPGQSNLCAFALVSWDNTSGLSITTITYGGNTMSPVGAAVENINFANYAQAFYLVNPPTGSNTLSIAASSGTNEIYANLVSFYNCNQSIPVRSGTYITSTGSAASATQTISSATTDLTIGLINSLAGFGSTYSNQTQDGFSDAGSYGAASDHATTAANSITDTFTMASSNGYALLGFSVQPPSTVSLREFGLLGCGI